MAKSHHPRRGSMQFWPRKRSKHSLVRVRSWAKPSQAKPLGFICYKAGMTHVMVTDNSPKSITKGDTVALPSTIIECPPMTIVGVAFYNKSRKITSVLAEKLAKYLPLQLPKKATKKIADVKDYTDLRLLVASNPKKTIIGTKKSKLMEIALGGSTEDKLAYATEVLGKEISINDVFESGNLIDAHGVTKGQGFQGTVKRFGVAIKQHKGEKTKRGIGNLGAWTPKRVHFTVPQPGKMGYHLRTEYNKQILKIGEDGQDVNRKGGLPHYGLVKNPYLLIKGSLVGPRKSAVVLTHSIRPNKKLAGATYDISSISQ
jgi:large subunit ribosomal protein L3